MMDEAESAKMANMAWFNAVLIVALHVMNFAKPADAASWWFYTVVYRGLCPMAVPFFFFASGFFLGRHVDEPGWWLRELKKRVRTILVPYAIFTFASFALEVGHHAMAAVMSGGSAASAVPTVREFADAMGLNPFALPAHDVLWFLRKLMLLVCLAPLFAAAIRRTGLLLPGLAMLLLSMLQMIVQESASQTWVVLAKKMFTDSGFAFFTFGLFLRMRGHGVVVSRRAAAGFLAAAAVLWTLSASAVGGCLGAWRSLFFVPVNLCLIFGLVGFAPGVRLPWVWTSFAVFVLHTYVTSAMRIGAALPSAYSCGYYVCVIGFAVGVPMGVAWVLNEYAKPLAAVLFGGRVKSGKGVLK